MENDISNIVIDPNGKTVTYNLNGNRVNDDTKQLTKVYSAYDSELLMQAIYVLQDYYQSISTKGMD